MTEARTRILDELLVMHCQNGSPWAFDLLVRRWQRRLWQYARRLVGSDDAAWDVVQETWVVVLKGIRGLNDPAWFRTWAYRVVRNKAADHWRRAGRRRSLAEGWAERRKADEPPAAAGGRADAVAAAMGRLAEDRQELLALRYGEGLSTIEIAVVLGIPAGTVKSRLYHAREQLRQLLEGGQS